MLPFRLFTATLLTFATLATAHIPSLPSRTPLLTEEADGVHGFTPKPTSGLGSARYGVVDPRDLFARQEPSYEQICGYEERVSSWSIICGPGYACGYDKRVNYAMCCSTNAAGTWASTCTVATTCRGYGGDYSGSYPSTGNNIVWCPSASPKCDTNYFIGMSVGDSTTYTNFGCTTGSDTIHYAYPTYTPAGPISSTSSRSTTSRTITSPLPTAPAPQSSETSSTTTSNTVPNSSPTLVAPPAQSANAGAIAGGVVGGVGGIALIAAAVVFFLKRRKAKAHKVVPPEISTIG